MAHDSEAAEALSASGETDEESAAREAKEKLLETARARYKLGVEAEADNRLLALDDQKFRAGDHWPADLKAQRLEDGRPCLTINKMPQFEQQITNDQRQNRPSIKVHPVDDQADVETAKVYQGIIKHIEVSSSADTARDTAFESAVRGGFGFYRVVTEYASPTAFNQEIRVKRIRDCMTVILDPHHQEPDGSDAEWGFITERMAKDRFIAEFGESKLCESGEWETQASRAPDWVGADGVLVAEYFYKEHQEKEICLLSDGQVMEKAEAEAYLKASAVQAVDEMGQPMGEPQAQVQIVKSRKTRIPTVKWCKLNGVEALSETDWPGRWIPILPVYGAELVVDGELIRESLIRHAKDPARMYDFWKSAETEAITLAPKAPFVVAEGQIEGYEQDWEQANRKNHAFLKYKAYDEQGRPFTPPQRQNTEANVQAITQASMLAADEVKSVLGIYDASLGARSNETSGVAIQRRNQQAQTSNFHFTDNLNRTIRHEGRILVDLIPYIYDAAQIARIIGDDGEQKLVPINQDYQDESGKTVRHDMGVGEYDVTLDTGPSYATKRQESADFMQNMIKAYPPVMQMAGDLVMKSMDVPGASDLAERFKKGLDPKFVDDPKSKQIPPQVQAQMQQMGQMIEQLTGKLHEAHDALDSKRIELESRERIEMAKLETTATVELAKLESKESLNLLAHQIAELDRRTQMLGMNEPFPSDAEPQEQVSQAAPMDGVQAPQSFDAQPQPTGGQSPGQPMEQFSDDRSQF